MSIIPNVTVKSEESGHCVAYFGYTSTYKTPVTITPGPNNGLTGSIAGYANIPTVFYPGEHYTVFTVQFDCAYVRWHVQTGDGKYTAVAVNNTCAPDIPDCSGTCGGDKKIDCTGVCGGDNTVDCAGVCQGNAEIDCAGVCGGDSYTTPDGKCVSLSAFQVDSNGSVDFCMARRKPWSVMDDEYRY